MSAPNSGGDTIQVDSGHTLQHEDSVDKILGEGEGLERIAKKTFSFNSRKSRERKVGSMYKGH